MKKHAIIPIFIPHMGCNNMCVFCNQNKISAKSHIASEKDIERTIETYLSTLSYLNPKDIEIAFYGGSFTGIPMAYQCKYLSIAKRYVDSNKVGGVHISTRPDYISPDILDNLKRYGVKTIELGVQSFDDKVLKKSKRGHNSCIVKQAANLISEYGFVLGIQLMIGLPGDSMESCIDSAKEAVKLKPQLARLYPTIVIDDTELFDMYESGSYVPLSQEDAIERTKAMYTILDDAGITIMRVGLKSTDLIGNGELSAINGGTYHPAFRQLVESEIAYDKINELLIKAFHNYIDINICGDTDSNNFKTPIKVDIYSNPAWFSNMIGNRSTNKGRFKKQFPFLNIKFKVDDTLSDKEFRISY